MTSAPPRQRSGANRPAAVGLGVGFASLPAALTFVGGLVLGLAAVILGFLGVARSHELDGAGEGLSVAAVVLGMLGMAIPVAISVFLT